MDHSIAAFVSIVLVTVSCGGRLLEDETGSNTIGSGGDGGSATATSTPGTPPPTIDAGTPKKDASTLPDGSIGAPGTVTCSFGAEVCNGNAGEVCCALFGPGKVISASCVTGACAGGADQVAEPYPCDGAEDCTGGKVCCAYRGGGSGCETSEACNLNTDHLQLCHKEDDCAALAGTRCCFLAGLVVPSGQCRPTCL